MRDIHTVAIVNHGCKLNQYEGESIESSLEKIGFRIVDLKGDVRPEVVIVNTCTVTNRSDRKSRNTILRASRNLGKDGLLIVTGCYAQTDGDELKQLDGVDFVIDSGEKAAIPDLIASHFGVHAPGYKLSKGPFDYQVPVSPHRSRVFIKVQDGCDMHCAYCKVPLARGRSVSRDPDAVITALNNVCEKGYREVVLTGVNIGSYDYDGWKLERLLSQILEKTSDSLRIRLSSIEPDGFSDALFDVVTNNRIMPHFHIPLQSGSDRILKRMNRRCGVGEYIDIVGRIRSVQPDCHIATDIIVGFPGERDEDYAMTLRTVEDIRFASLHVFRYSPRRGTVAALLGDELTPAKKQERSKELIALGEGLNYTFRKGFEGSVRNAVFEQKGGACIGITDNYIRVQVEGIDGDLSRKLLPVRINSADMDKTTGTLV
jgi:threonylcarbamoyladenosine tRNA methylthiotransferase MtaB